MNISYWKDARLKTLKEVEEELLRECINTYYPNEGWKIMTAEAMGVSLKTVYSMLKRYGLNQYLVRKQHKESLSVRKSKLEVETRNDKDDKDRS